MINFISSSSILGIETMHCMQRSGIAIIIIHVCACVHTHIFVYVLVTTRIYIMHLTTVHCTIFSGLAEWQANFHRIVDVCAFFFFFMQISISSINTMSVIDSLWWCAFGWFSSFSWLCLSHKFVWCCKAEMGKSETDRNGTKWGLRTGLFWTQYWSLWTG